MRPGSLTAPGRRAVPRAHHRALVLHHLGRRHLLRERLRGGDLAGLQKRRPGESLRGVCGGGLLGSPQRLTTALSPQNVALYADVNGKQFPVTRGQDVGRYQVSPGSPGRVRGVRGGLGVQHSPPPAPSTGLLEPGAPQRPVGHLRGEVLRRGVIQRPAQGGGPSGGVTWGALSPALNPLFSPHSCIPRPSAITRTFPVSGRSSQSTWTIG